MTTADADADITLEVVSHVEALAAIRRVRALHVRSVSTYCVECYANHPCPTIRVLDGETLT